MTLLVALTGWDVDVWVNRLKRLMPERDIVALGEPFDRRAVHYAVSWKHPPGSLAGLPNLEAIFSLGAGVDHLLTDPRLPDVPVARVVDANLTNRMSEWIVMHCLMQLRQHKRYAAQQARKEWIDDRDQPAAADVRVGVMGTGVLGQDAMTKLKMMGFDVAGWGRSAKTINGIETFSGADGLKPFLARTDILVALIPLTDDTRGILARPVFTQLARDGRLGGPALINAGRGGLQVETDILACLNDGTLREAVLDVFETEPLPQESPLWTHPAVTVTPHNSAMSDPEAIGQLIVRQIARLEAGEPLEHTVTIARGY